MTELFRRSATELVRDLASGACSAREAVDACIARIEAVNPGLNAVVVKRYELARAEAQAADARRARGESLPPLHGLPVTVKDSLDLAGFPSTVGLKHRAQSRADRDEAHVARLRAAGAIVLGKTNVSQCLLYTEADNPLYGRTVNPWNAARTCGGSSGGEGAIVAAGGSPLGLGTDIGGSVRLPAAFCGVAGLKPTSGRADDLGGHSVPLGQRAIPSQVGVLARRARDVALGFGAITATGPDLPPRPDPAGVDVRALRIGFYLDDGSFTPAPAVQRAVRMAADTLRATGAQVTEWAPPDARAGLAAFGGILTADGGAGLRRALAGDAPTPQLRQLLAATRIPVALVPALRALLRALGQTGMAQNLEAFGPRTADRYWQLVEWQIRYRRRFAAAMDAAGPLDLLLAPACSLPAFTHGATRDLLTAGAYAALYNLLGYPAGVVPVTRVHADEESARKPGADLIQKLARRVEQGSRGLPVGVQIVGRPWREDLVLAAMQALDERLGEVATPVDPA